MIYLSLYMNHLKRMLCPHGAARIDASQWGSKGAGHPSYCEIACLLSGLSMRDEAHLARSGDAVHVVAYLRTGLVQFHGQDGLGDAPSIHPALESILHSPLQGIAALKLVEVGRYIPTASLTQCITAEAHQQFSS